jgi:Zn-dependent protease
MNLQRLIFFLELLPGLIIGLTVHEAAHALSAKWLGDRNAERMGRVSLNPFKHLSPLGTAALFVIGFGWGKPVIVNLYNFERPKLYYFLSSIAGPISNLLLCAISLGVLYLRPPWYIVFLCKSIFYINAILAVVNLLPIPPLDGSKIWPCVIPRMKPTFTGKWSLIWLVAVFILLRSGVLDDFFRQIDGFLTGLLPK